MQELGTDVAWENDIWETSAEIPYWWRVTTQIWVVTRHQYGISALVDQTPFGGEISSSVAKCRLFSQARTDDNEVMKDNIIWKLHECTLEVNLSFIVFLKHGARVAVSENLQRISIDSA